MNDSTLQAQDRNTTEAPRRDDDVSAPEPKKIELPELPYDKAQLKGITKLDAMIVERAWLQATVDHVNSLFERAKLAASTSLNGNAEQQVKALLSIVDGLQDFERAAGPVARLARKRFMKQFASDDDFGRTYRETYSAAEDELDEVIGDGETRRAVCAAMMNSYRNAPRTQLEYLETMLEDGGQLREKTIQNVVRSAETDMMVADFKKGRALTELLQSTRNKLELVARLEPESSALRSVLEQVDKKAASRREEIEKARADARFPEAYSATNAPKDAARLEASMRKALESSGHHVEKIAIASSWIAVRSALGVHLYNQIDFHVAVRSREPEEAKAGVLDILYVTGKTGTPSLTVPFARRSAGRVGQMLAANL